MSDVIQFPPEASTANIRGEPTQTIKLLDAVNQLTQGGLATYTDVSAWKNANYGKASAYTGIVIEFSVSATTAKVVIGDGTLSQAIGLFGEISGVGKFFLGLLGTNLGGVVPQVVITSQGTDAVGSAQITCDISVYDRLSVGGVFGAIAITGETPQLTVRARPIRNRDYIG